MCSACQDGCGDVERCCCTVDVARTSLKESGHEKLHSNCTVDSAEKVLYHFDALSFQPDVPIEPDGPEPSVQWTEGGPGE